MMHKFLYKWQSKGKGWRASLQDTINIGNKAVKWATAHFNSTQVQSSACCYKMSFWESGGGEVAVVVVVVLFTTSNSWPTEIIGCGLTFEAWLGHVAKAKGFGCWLDVNFTLGDKLLCEQVSLDFQGHGMHLAGCQKVRRHAAVYTERPIRKMILSLSCTVCLLNTAFFQDNAAAAKISHSFSHACLIKHIRWIHLKYSNELYHKL